MGGPPFPSEFSLIADLVEGNDVDLGVEGQCNNEAPQLKGDGEIVEPHVGMEFATEEEARKFYTEYATRVGFVARLMQPLHSENNKDIGGTLVCCCNEHGMPHSSKAKTGPEKKARPGCNATILFKLNESGKWVINKFVREHDHPLDVVTARHKHTNPHEKDKKINGLKRELQRQEEEFAESRERFIDLVADIEKREHLSPNVLAVVESVRKAEAEAIVLSRV